MSGAALRAVVATFSCPACGTVMHLYRTQRWQSPRSSIRERIQAHAHRRHPTMTRRERSLLADEAASRCRAAPNEDERAIRVETPTEDERAEHVETPNVGERAMSHETPRQEERATVEETPNVRERANLRETPREEERANLQEIPNSSERAKSVETPTALERATRFRDTQRRRAGHT